MHNVDYIMKLCSSCLWFSLVAKNIQYCIPTKVIYFSFCLGLTPCKFVFFCKKFLNYQQGWIKFHKMIFQQKNRKNKGIRSCFAYTSRGEIEWVCLFPCRLCRFWININTEFTLPCCCPFWYFLHFINFW